MKVNAMSVPDAIQKMPNGFACNYNIEEKTQTIENQQVTSYNYDQIRVENIEYGTIVLTSITFAGITSLLSIFHNNLSFFISLLIKLN